MSKKHIVIIIIIVLLVLGVSFWANKMNKEKGYSMVYLTTGEVYVGKLSTFPDFTLKDIFILQAIPNSEDPNKNDFNLNPIKDALWAPKVLYLVKKNVVFYGPLSPESAIAKKLAEQPK